MTNKTERDINSSDNMIDNVTNKNGTDNRSKGTGNREHSCNRISARYYRCLAEQEAHRRGIVCCLSRLYCKLRKENETVEPRESTGNEKSQQGQKDRSSSIKTVNIFIFSLSLLFVSKYYMYLMSLDFSLMGFDLLQFESIGDLINH